MSKEFEEYFKTAFPQPCSGNLRGFKNGANHTWNYLAPIISKLQQQNKELREEVERLKKLPAIEKNTQLYYENQDLKAFIKEACEVVKSMKKPKHNWFSDIFGGECHPSCDACKLEQFMNTDKYREYSE